MTDGTVEFRAFRGTRRSSLYQVHSIDAASFARIRAAAGPHQLALLRSLEPGQLDKQEARQLADELGALRATLELPDLDADLTTLGDVARWCSRASGEAWLTVA
jgi:hypothetical protein